MPDLFSIALNQWVQLVCESIAVTFFAWRERNKHHLSWPVTIAIGLVVWSSIAVLVNQYAITLVPERARVRDWLLRSQLSVSSLNEPGLEYGFRVRQEDGFGVDIRKGSNAQYVVFATGMRLDGDLRTAFSALPQQQRARLMNGVAIELLKSGVQFQNLDDPNRATVTEALTITGDTTGTAVLDKVGLVVRGGKLMQALFLERMATP